MQENKLWIRVLGVFFVMALTAACSKKLMPPEIESTGSIAESELEEVAEGVDATQGFTPEQDFPIDGTGSEESGFVRQENLADSGLGGSSFVREENLTESGAVAGAPIISSFDEAHNNSSVAGAPNNSSVAGAHNNSSVAGAPNNSSVAGAPNNSSEGGFSDDSAANGGRYNPFAKGPNGQGSGSGLGTDQGIQEARLYSFRPTSELKDIHFEFDKYDLDSRSKGVLKQNADFLKQHPSVKVEIQGHCDERGTNNYNLALGQRRAASTKRYLASLGIPENRLHVISYGEEKPFCGESSEGCWWRNRRAHFMVAE